MKRRILLLMITLSSVFTYAQKDTISIMYYNLLDFPSGGADRVDTLEKIIRYVEPDLFLVNELESLFGAELILNSAMNTSGVTHYSRATFYNGADTDNMLYYNHDKIGLAEQSQIATATRDISEYKIYFKEPNMSASTDTIFMWLYSCHLKAGSFQTDIDRRESEATSFKNYLQSKGRSGNLFIGGDFNFYTSSEPGCQMILNGGTVPFNDPINQLGSWNNNGSYAPQHTQCTRSSTGYAGGASGGMDDRFDFIFVSDEVLSGSSNVDYLIGSYKAIGQDGSHFNQDINSGTNFAVPADIADALFYNSDHLPVYMEMTISYPVGVQEVEEAVSSYYILDGQIYLQLKEGVSVNEVSMYNLSGQQLQHHFSGDISYDISGLPVGVYLLNVKSSVGVSTVKFVKQ